MNNVLILLIILINESFSKIYSVKVIKSKIKSLRNLGNKNYLSRVFGDTSNLNYYYSTFYLGDNKEPQTYILDTGSGITTSPCSLCKSNNCGLHINKPYKFKGNEHVLKCGEKECSTLSRNNCNSGKCSFSISYLEGSSLKGIYLREKIFFENINNKSVSFSQEGYPIEIGCTTKETHLFVTQKADGIVGLNNDGGSFISLLYQKNIIKQNIFSLCFASEGGYISLGEVATKNHKERVKYVPQLEGYSSYYYVRINNIIINNKKIFNSYSAMIDSGTTITYFPNSIYNAILSAISQHCRNKKCGVFKEFKDFGQCVQFKNLKEMSDTLYNEWPDITIEMDGYKFIWKPANYYYNYTEDKIIKICLGFLGESTSKITLGTSFMHDHDIIFDREKRKIGFAEAECNYEESSNKFNFHTKFTGKNIINKVNNFLFLIICIIIIIIVIILVSILCIIKGKKNKIKYIKQIDVEKEKDIKKSSEIKQNITLDIAVEQTPKINDN